MTTVVLHILSWCRRNPGKTAIVLVLLFILPSWNQIVWQLGGWFVALVAKIFGTAAGGVAATVAKVVSKVVTFLQQPRWRWLTAFAVVFIWPLLGVVLLVKHIVDALRERTVSTAQTTSAMPPLVPLK